MSYRYIEGLSGLSRVLELWEAELPLGVAALVEQAGIETKELVDKIYGDTSKLDNLAAATQADRVSQGYSADEPLLRTGELLKDSVRVEHSGLDTISIVSDEPIHAYMEYGYYNVAANLMVPPRAVFRTAVAEAIPIIELLASKEIEKLLALG